MRGVYQPWEADGALVLSLSILYGKPRAPLLLPWLGEVQGVSLAMTQGKALPVLAHTLMFRVPTVLYGGRRRR